MSRVPIDSGKQTNAPHSITRFNVRNMLARPDGPLGG